MLSFSLQGFCGAVLLVYHFFWPSTPLEKPPKVPKQYRAEGDQTKKGRLNEVLRYSTCITAEQTCTPEYSMSVSLTRWRNRD